MKSGKLIRGRERVGERGVGERVREREERVSKRRRGGSGIIYSNL